MLDSPGMPPPPLLCRPLLLLLSRATGIPISLAIPIACLCYCICNAGLHAVQLRQGLQYSSARVLPK